LFSAEELSDFDEQYERWKDSVTGATIVGLEKVKGAAKSVGRAMSR
jgi:hypothetical protein